MKINLIYLFYELNGAYTSFEDTFYNLKRFTNHDVRFIILYEDKNFVPSVFQEIPLEIC